MASGRALFLLFLFFVSIECREWDSAEEWTIGNVKHTRCRCHRTTEWERSPFPFRVLNCSAIFWPSDGATMREMAAKMREFPDCIDEEAILDLSHNGLLDFNTSGLFTDFQRSLVRQLDLSGNRLERMGQHVIGTFPQLTVLKLSNNRLGVNGFSSSWLHGTSSRTLKELHLDANALERVPSNAFARLTALEKLALDGNPRFVNSSFLEALELPSSVKELSLEACGLKYLTHMPAQMRKLETLSLARNKLRYLPSIFRDFSRLRTLDLSGNPLESISFVLPQLVELKMRQMPRLYSIQDGSFSLFIDLRVLDFAGSSELSTIHPNAFGFGQEGPKARALRVLNVENCGLTKLNSRTFPWTQLEELHLGGNPWNCDPSMEWLFRAYSTRRWTTGRNLTCAFPWSRRGMEPRLAYDTPISYTPAWQRDSRTTDRWDRWATTRQPRFPFWFAESTRSVYTDELGGEVDEWWARDVMPTLRSAPHHPAVYFAAGAIASAVVLLAACCCCQAVGCCFRRCCCPKPRSSWGVRNEAADDRRLIADDDTKTEVDTISNI